jgi:hypothetical protein
VCIHFFDYVEVVFPQDGNIPTSARFPSAFTNGNFALADRGHAGSL